MTEPAKRLQRSRRKGIPIPEGSVYVGRPTMWCNPFQERVGGHARSVILHRQWLDGHVGPVLLEKTKRFSFGEIEAIERLRCRVLTNLHRLAGKDLVCWCPLTSDWCHANTLLHLARLHAEYDRFAA